MGHLPFVSHRRHEQLRRNAQTELALQQVRIRELERVRDEMAEQAVQLGHAIGLHIERPYREDMVGGVTFPVHLSAFVLRELSKRTDRDELIAQALADQVAIEVLRMLDDPAYEPQFRDALP